MEPKEQVDAAIKAAGEAISLALDSDQLSDIDRAKLAAYAVDQANVTLVPELVARRREAVRLAREAMPVAEVAEQMGLSKVRVYQILDGR